MSQYGWPSDRLLSQYRARFLVLWNYSEFRPYPIIFTKEIRLAKVGNSNQSMSFSPFFSFEYSPWGNFFFSHKKRYRFGFFLEKSLNFKSLSSESILNSTKTKRFSIKNLLVFPFSWLEFWENSPEYKSASIRFSWWMKFG